MEQPSLFPEILPILPSKKKTLVYPTTVAMMQVEHESALRLLDEVKESQHRLLVIAAQKSPDKVPGRLSDLFRVGTIARLVQMKQITEDKREIAVIGLERGAIGALVQEQPYLLANIAPKADLVVPEEGSSAAIKRVVSSFQELIARSQRMPLHEITPQFEHKTLRESVYTMAFFSDIDLEHGQQLLEADSVLARLASLKEYLTAELERFNREWQESYERAQHPGQTVKKYQIALDMLNTAATLEDASQILTKQKALLLKRETLDTLQACISQKKLQNASIRWIFLLQQDLEILEEAYKHGLSHAKQRLNARIKMLQQQQSVYEAMKVLTMLDINDSQTFMSVVDRQETAPFSRETFRSLYALTEQMDTPEYKKQLQALLHFLEDVQLLGKEQAMLKHLPDFQSETNRTIDLLKEYLTSASPDMAYLTLKQHQDILLSDIAYRLMELQIAERYGKGDYRNANMLEVHLSLFEDARERGLEAAWQTFIEDSE